MLFNLYIVAIYAVSIIVLCMFCLIPGLNPLECVRNPHVTKTSQRVGDSMKGLALSYMHCERRWHSQQQGEVQWPAV